MSGVFGVAGAAPLLAAETVAMRTAMIGGDDAAPARRDVGGERLLPFSPTNSRGKSSRWRFTWDLTKHS